MKRLTVKSMVCYAFIAIFSIFTLSADELRVVSYNIKHGQGMDGKVNLDRQAAIIKQQKAELVALQEVDKLAARSGGVDQAKYLGEKLGMHFAFGKAIPLGAGEYGQAILSKYPIIDTKIHRLPSVGEARIVLEVQIKHPKLGVISFASAHYSYKSEKERFPQVLAFESVVDSYKHPVILTGDFNATPETKTIQHYASKWALVEKKGARLTSPAHKPKSEIDFCALRNFPKHTAESVVLDEAVASDHRPVLTVIKF